MRNRRFFSSHLPGHIRTSLPRDARASATEVADGNWVAAGRTHLWIGEHSYPWTDFRSVEWDGDRRTLTLHNVDGGQQIVELAHDDVYTFTTAVRERLEASIAYHLDVEIPDGLVQVLIRRGADGTLLSQTIVLGRDFDAQALADPQIARMINRAEAQARQAVGWSGA